ncbi:Arginase/deacetylase [Aspergillus ellipticus CBS 707.79]|uniref:Arginase/deacetylase n=1 Tax=Aspergillus ellipticus CBS 707.79 TaxID=1448320 RepID=A0A319E189_9EURO|nr:Arginase/deacetylase [Aspergillus ellipticus CBS 707.79]
MTARGVTIIFSPYHVGIRDHRVGNGPHRIRQLGVVNALEGLGITVHTKELDPVDNFEGEIGAGVACGLQLPDLQFIYFDAHDDLDSPDVSENGYFDAMGLSMLRGESWKTLMQTVPGYRPFSYDGRFLYCGLRDQSDLQRQRVIAAGMTSIWGETNPALVHLDLHVLDDSYGKVNDYPSPGGLFEDELLACMGLVPLKATPKSLTICSFDPNAGDGDKIAKIAIRAVVSFFCGLIDTGVLAASKDT